VALDGTVSRPVTFRLTKRHAVRKRGRAAVHWLEQETALLAFVKRLTQEDLDGAMEYQTINFGVYRNALWQSMQHLVNHGTYHRGQVTTLLRQLGARPILTDLMHFYRERAAAGA
jgi:uncharacterized damage-inducible protein DinB